MLDGHLAAALAFASILSGATAVARLAAAHAFAIILAGAGVLRRGGAAALSFTTILRGAAVIAAGATALAAASIHALASMLLGGRVRVRCRRILRVILARGHDTRTKHASRSRGNNNTERTLHDIYLYICSVEKIGRLRRR